jgi:3-oxoacyl-[acyl-carrier-protein] synthase II
MGGEVVITGIGLLTPLGTGAPEVLRRLKAGDAASRPPDGFDPAPYGCPVCAAIPDLDPEQHVPEPKSIRLMNRDAILAVAAARLALADAGLRVGEHYPSDEVALFGSTGMAGLPLAEVAPLVRHAAGPDGRFDPQRFGAVALKRVRPVLSFRILSNMPVSFVSIFTGVQGPNAVYNPWEGQGAHAILAGLRAIRRGDAACALVGGCDSKVHELAFIALAQQGVFGPWHEEGAGPVPGEGAAYLVLEDEAAARRRGARIYARVSAGRTATVSADDNAEGAMADLVRSLVARQVNVTVSAADGDAASRRTEERALSHALFDAGEWLRPKPQVGNLFAAAAAVQVALAAAVAGGRDAGTRVLANAFGHGSEKAVFLLESV